jgi:uncharacterized protein involved in outer membrane biogenesis
MKYADRISIRLSVTIALAVVAAAILATLLYVAFADLGRHKARIETLISQQVGRPFAIDGALKLRVFPSVSVLAERVRLANAAWGSKPQMAEIGRLSTEVGLWSLISGPVDIRSFELSDVSILLEKSPDGAVNWALGGAAEPEEESEPSTTGVPVVIENGEFRNVRLVYRESGKPDRVAFLEALTIGPGENELLRLSGKGSLDEYPLTLTGDIGPMKALFSGRDMRMAMQAGLGNLRVDVQGGIGRLEPLDGADLTLKIENPDLGTMLKKLRLPVLATGALRVDAALKDAGSGTQLDLDAKFGDITARTNGTLRTLGLVDSDLRFEASVSDAARLAQVFDVTGVPAEALHVKGHVTSSHKEIKFDGIDATLADAKARADGTIQLTGKKGTALKFELAAKSLAKLRAGLPDASFSASGSFLDSSDKIELKNIKARLGKSEVSGSASMLRSGTKHIEADLASPLLDLASRSAEGGGSDSKAKSGGARPPSETKKAPPKNKEKFVFTDAPLTLGTPRDLDAKLHLVVSELRLTQGVLKDVDGTLIADSGLLSVEGSAQGPHQGTLEGSLTVKPTGEQGANDLNLDVTINKVRVGVAAGGEVDPEQAPPMDVLAKIQTSGTSARQMAAGSNGQVLLVQGQGKVVSGFLGIFGGDVLTQLASKLNPFQAQDEYTHLDCSVVLADIKDGQVSVTPVLMQAQKVTVTAHGKIDLHTEQLNFDFETRPREGIGVSPGMFTNPFIRLQGTLSSPMIGVGAKGVASGAVAAMTGGVSVLAKGMVDRVRGEADVCAKTLEEARHPAPADEVATGAPLK